MNNVLSTLQNKDLLECVGDCKGVEQWLLYDPSNIRDNMYFLTFRSAARNATKRIKKAKKQGKILVLMLANISNVFSTQAKNGYYFPPWEYCTLKSNNNDDYYSGNSDCDSE